MTVTDTAARRELTSGQGVGAPTISVLMTVYNGARHLPFAVQSILDQSEPDFELVVVDDGSTDGSAALIETIADPRIRLLKLPHEGLTRALNAGGAACRGEFIARMDADDIAHRDRLKLQRGYLSAHPEIHIVCSDIVKIDLDGKVIGEEAFAGLDNDVLRDGLLYRRQIKPVVHPTVMMRRKVLVELGGYRDFASAEDHDLWLRCVDRFRIRRLSDKLLEYRVNPAGISQTKAAEQRTSAAMSAVNYLVERKIGVDLFESDPARFEQLQAIVAERIERELSRQIASFERARGMIRGGRPFAGVATLLGGALRYGPAVFPRVALGRLHRIVSEVGNRAADALARCPRCLPSV